MATRRERVVLDLVDNFSTGMAKAAAATAVLNRELESLSGTSVETSRDTDRVKESFKGVGDETDRTSKKTKDYNLEQAVAAEKASRLRKSLQDQARALVDQETGFDRAGRAIRVAGDDADDASDAFRRGASDIDRYSGRLRLLTDVALTIGPALIPIGAAAVPAVFGLAAGFGAAAGAAGTALLAFNGVGDALKAIDAAQLEPTTENLDKMRASLDSLGPAGAQFAQYLDSLEPQLHALQDAARAGLFPGLEDGLNQLLGLMPEARTLLFDMGTALGNLAAEAGDALSGDKFAGFFNYLHTDAVPTLEAFGHATGNVVQGLASLMTAFAPLSRDFTGGLESMTQSFAEWADGLSKTQGFRDFVDYIEHSGPQVVELLGALGSALVGILRAAAPVGDAVLPILTGLANTLAAIADSPIGGPLFTAAAALVAFNRAATLGAGAVTKYRGAVDALNGSLSGLGKVRAAGGAVGALLLVESAAAEMIRQTDKAAPSVETLTRDLLDLGSARGMEGLATNLGDLTGAIETLADPGLAQNIGSVYDKVPLIGSAFADMAPGLRGARQDAREAADSINSLDEALAQMVTSGSPRQAKDAFDQLSYAYRLTDEQQAQLLGLLPKYQDALTGAANGADLAAGATRRLGRNAGLSAAEVEGLTKAMEEQVSEAGSAFDAVTRYAEALDAARAAAAKGARGIDASTKAGRENRDALAGLRDAWNNQGEAVRNNLSKYAAARAEFIRLAEQMGVGSEKARKLADDMLAIPKFINTRVNAYTDDAKKRIREILVDLAGIPRSISTTYYVNRVNAINKGGYEPNPANRAGGGPIYGPGTKTSDSVPIMASRGEFMMSAAAVDYYGLDAMFAMNARRLASGGSVDGFARVGAGGTPEFALLGPAHAVGVLFGNIADQGKKELEVRKRLLDKEVERDQKAVDAAKQHRDAVLEDIKSLRQSVAERFKSDLFNQQQSDFTIDMPQTFDSAEQAQAWFNAQQTVRDAQNQVNDPISILRNDIAQAREARRLYRQLRQAGLHGAALTYAQQNASNEQLAALLADPTMLRQYQRLYGVRQEVAGSAGQLAATQRFGNALERSNRELVAANKALHELQQISRQQEKRLAAIEKNTKDAPKKTGDAVGDKLDKAGARAGSHR